MYSWNDFYSAAATWATACLGFITSEYIANKFLLYGSVLLVAVRLCYEVPKAINAIKKRRRGKNG